MDEKWIKKSKGAIATSHGRGIIRASEGATKSTKKDRWIVRAGYGRSSLKSSGF